MITEAEIAIAAKWWADHLRKNNPLYRNAASYSSEQVEAFEAALRNAIDKRLDWSPTERAIFLEIHVEYDPNDILSEAADHAGIDIDAMPFPRKTTMQLKEGLIEVLEKGEIVHRFLVDT